MQERGGDIQNTAFDVNDINTIKKEIIELLNQAEEAQSELSSEMAELTDILNQVPQNATNVAGLKNAVNQLNAVLGQESYETYKNQVKKNLDRIKENVPKTDQECAAALQKSCDTLKKIQQDIQSISAMIPKTGKGINSEKLQKEIDYYTKKLENFNNNELKSTMQEAAEFITFLKGGDLPQTKSSIDPVNLSTGNFYYGYSDIKIQGEPMLDFHRFYNALYPREGSLGIGWHHPYEVRLQIEPERIIIIKEDGQEESFEIREGGNFYGEATRNQLSKIENGYCYQRQDASQQIFDKMGRYQSFTDAQGNEIHLEYEEEFLTKVIRKTDGAYICFSYDEHGKLASIEDSSGRKAAYTYEEEKLKTVENVLGETYHYSYDQEGHLSTIENPQAIRLVETEYDEKGRAKKQSFPDKSSMTFSYDEEKGEVLLCERDGSKTIYCHNERYQNVKVIYEDGTQEVDLYNKKGQITMHRDALGRATRYAYDGKGNLTQVIDPLGNKSNATYNRQNQLLTLRVNGNEKQKNIYDEKGRLIKSTNALGQSRQIIYGQNGKTECIQLEDGSELKFSYDDKGNQTVILDPYGVKTYYQYDELNRIVEEYNPAEGTIQYTYDAQNRIVEIKEAGGIQTEYKYHTNGQIKKAEWNAQNVEVDYNEVGCVKSRTDANGNTTEYAYNEMWKIKEIRYPNGGVYQYTYNKKGQLETETDPLGNQTLYSYDAVGNLIKEEKKGIGEIQYAYDVLDRLISYTNMDGYTTTYRYDEDDNLTELINPKGETIRYCYNAGGELTEETNAMGYTIYYSYTPLGQLQTIKDDIGEIAQFEYEAGGRLKQVERIDGMPAAYEYDKDGNISRVDRISGESISYQYDNQKRIVGIYGANGQKEEYTYDKNGFLCMEQDAKGHANSYVYDKNGNMTCLKDALGNESIYQYDVMNRLVEIKRYAGQKAPESPCKRIRYERDLNGNVLSVTDEANRIEKYTYDAAGRMQTKTDREGNLTKYIYSREGKLLHISYADGKESRFAYEKNGALKEIEDWTGKTTMENDAMGRVKKLCDPNGKQIAYRYSLRGEKTGICYPDGTWCEYHYNEKGYLSELCDGEDSIHYSYDSYGRLKKKTLPGEIQTEYQYTPDGWIESMVTRGKNHSLYEQHDCTYDTQKNRTEIHRKRLDAKEAEGRYHYNYDALGRLLEVSKDGALLRSYAYDAWGNRLSKKEYAKEGTKETQYSYQPSGELLSETDGDTKRSYRYDMRGNLIEIHRNGKTEKTYRYDCRNRLEEVQAQDGTVVNYLYHSLGYRLKREERHPDGNIFCKDYTVDFTKKAENLLEETDETESYRYLWDGRAAIQKNEKTSRYYLTDELGSPIRLLDQNGNTLETYGYQEFGEAIYADSSQPFTYTGYQLDPIAGTYFAQAREYNPSLGRFQAEDIIRGNIFEPQSLNHYTYCYNNPEKYVDEDGEWLTIVAGAAIGGIWDFGSTIIEAKVKGEEVNLKEAGINFVKGAAKGAVAGSGAGLAGCAIAEGFTDFFGDMATQKIVEEKSWNDMNVGKSLRIGVSSAVETAAFGKIAKSSLVKDKILKGKTLNPFKEEAQKSIQEVKILGKERKILERTLKGSDVIEEGENMAVKMFSNRKESISELKKFAYNDFIKEELDTYKGWGKSMLKSHVRCGLQNGGMA